MEVPLGVEVPQGFRHLARDADRIADRKGADFGERLENIEHFPQYLVERPRNRKAVFTGKVPCLQKKVERVHMVVKGLLEVHSVGADLALRLFQKDSPSLISPVFGCRNLRA